jgi:outer membrane lipoprotein-sorting protein
MRFITKGAFALLAVGAVALSGCTTGGAEKDEADVLTLLRTDATKSLQTSLAKAGKAKSAKFTIEGKSDGEAVKGAGLISYGDSPKARYTLEDPKDGPTEIIILPNAIYIGIAEKERAEYDGKEWLKLDIEAASKAVGAEAGQAMSAQYARQLRDMDPAAQVKSLIEGGKVSVVGEETIDGVKTVHYAGTSPISAYLADVPEKLRAKVESTLTKGGAKEVKVDVWVDEKYQPRRTRAVIGAEDSTVTFSDYGTKVDVVEPSADKSADFIAMLKELAELAKPTN